MHLSNKKLVKSVAFVVLFVSGFAANASMQRINGLKMQDFVPSQSSSAIAPNDRKWCCGPNSGARAIAMLPDGVCVRFDKHDQAFMKEAPATIGRRVTSFVHTAQASLFAVLAGIPLLNYGATKVTLIWTALIAAGVTTPWWLQSLAPVGPHPAALAAYLQEHVGNYEVKDLYFDGFQNALNAIRDAILKNDTPVIAHFCYGPFALHYANIVGIDDVEKEVEILETNGRLYRMSFADLERYMNTNVVGLNPLLFANFNVITFQPASS